MMDEKLRAGVIAFGLDESRKPRAGVFDAEAAKNAAGRGKVLKFVIVDIEGEALVAMAGELPKGDLAKEGTGFVPVVTRTLYERTLVAAGVTGSKAPTQEGRQGTVQRPPDHAAAPRRLPASWEDVQVGDLVLAEDPEPQCGWYEAIVLEFIGGDIYRLAFRDYPEEAEVLRNRNQLALMSPKSAAT